MKAKVGPSISSTASTRRHFLCSSSATVLSAASVGAANSLTPGLPARSASRLLGANDRINIGSIGCGGMGTGHIRSFMQQSEQKQDIQIVAVSDIYSSRKERARTVAKLAEKDAHHDYRELLARSDVDAVFIATPDHWHAQMAIDALAAGKDVYLQKPITYTIDEARRVAEAAAKHNRILQVGVQGVSDPRSQIARQIIEQGEIGELLWAQATSSRNSLYGEWNYVIDPEGSPETIDWNRWLGPAPKRRFSAERYFRWRKYWDYSGGIATDLYYHSLGPLLVAMGPQFPVAVSATGGIYIQKDREVPDTYSTVIEYPEFYISLSGSMANAAAVRYHSRVIYGHKGTILFEDNKVLVVPERLEARRAGAPIADPLNAVKTYDTPPVDNPHRLHTDNFFACVRSRKRPNLHPELGYQMMVAIRLGVDSYRERKVKFFDPRRQRVVDKASPRPAYEGSGQNFPSTPTSIRTRATLMPFGNCCWRSGAW